MSLDTLSLILFDSISTDLELVNKSIIVNNHVSGIVFIFEFLIIIEITVS